MKCVKIGQINIIQAINPVFLQGGYDPVFGSKGRAFLFTSGDKDDSDDEEVTRPMWGLTIKSDSTDDEDSDKSSESGSQPDSLPSDGKLGNYNGILVVLVKNELYEV